MINEYNKLIRDKKFKSWKYQHKNAYLCSVFLLKDQNDSSDWQFDYYLPRVNRMTTFIVGKKIEYNKDQKIFSNSEKIDKIELDDIKFDFDDVVKLVIGRYKNKRFIKEIIIIQSLNSKLAWNISLVTAEFNLVNIKVDAVDGKIIEETSSSLLQFKSS